MAFDLNHSPGPFEYDDGLGCKNITSAGQEIACTSGLTNEAEDEANARLFAMAPDLLDFVRARAEGGDDGAVAFLFARRVW